MSTSRSNPATTARESGSANGERLPRNSGKTWMSQANKAASPERRADRRPLEQAEIACGRLGQADAQRRAGCDDLCSNFRVAVRGKVCKTDALEIAAAPAVLVGKEIPLTSERAD